MKHIETMVRGLPMRLVTQTRALELCARMNRETEVLDYIDAIGPGEVLYDLGACEGRFAIYAALRGVQCWAFEPEALNYEALCQNTELNAAHMGGRLESFNAAVGHQCGTGKLQIAQPWAGGHQKVLAGCEGRVDLQFNFTEAQSVAVVGLDQFIADQGLPYPNHLKIDIDGSEMPFLDGARETLQRPELKSAMFELHELDPNFNPVVMRLHASGLIMKSRYEVEKHLYNILFKREAAQAVA